MPRDSTGQRIQVVEVKTPCGCRCGYRCGGPGVCELPALECIEKHYVRDCDHLWSSPFVTTPDGLGESVTCSKCGMSAMDHDMRCGP